MPVGPECSGSADSTGASTRAYDYDAFGVEKDPDPLDENPFRYCGEYYDGETKTYYLRARYYDPNIGRFTQQDTHWTTANSIYGDNPQKINEHEDKLGLKSYSYAPQITAVMQSGNLYVYGVNNPVAYVDSSGNEIAIACAIALIALAIGTTVAAFAILQKVIPDAYAASADLLRKLGMLLKTAKETLEEYVKRKAAEYAAAQAAAPTPDPNDKNSKKRSFKKIKSNAEANRVAQRNGYRDAETLKDTFANKNGSKFNIVRDTETGELYLKSINDDVLIPTGLFE